MNIIPNTHINLRTSESLNPASNGAIILQKFSRVYIMLSQRMYWSGIKRPKGFFLKQPLVHHNLRDDIEHQVYFNRHEKIHSPLHYFGHQSSHCARLHRINPLSSIFKSD